MSTSTYPPQRRLSGRWIAGGIGVIVLALIAGLAISAPRPPSVASTSTVTIGRGAIVASVDGTGTLAADRQLDLGFQVGGTIIEVLVAEGDTVAEGAALARLDDRELRLQVASAEAGLASARARLSQRERGDATPEEIAGAEASLASARANLEKIRTGNITAADLADAQAQLRSARARLDALRNPTGDDLVSAQASLDQAAASLAAQRGSLAAAKLRAENEIGQSANALRDRQEEYSRTYWQNREAEQQLSQFGQTLSQEQIDREASALRAVQNAETALGQAQVAYEQAKQDEISGLAQAEAQLREAEQRLRTAQRGASQSDIIQAEASVAQAQAGLDRLRSGGTPADIAAAQASVDQAAANLAQLAAPATATDQQIEAASVAQAQASLDQARLQLEQTVLRAPFAGVIGQVSVVEGGVVGAGGAAVQLIDRDPLHVDLRLSENDVARITAGMPVTLSVDALPGAELSGAVASIAPAAESSSGGVVTFRVRVDVAASDAAVRVGMTSSLRIIYASASDVLLVPNSALLPSGSGRSVQLVAADGSLSEVPVEVGLSDGLFSEVLSGLSEGQVISATPTRGPAQPAGPFGS